MRPLNRRRDAEASILLLASDPDVCAVIEHTLAPAGARIAVATDHVAGTALAEQLKPDVIVLDRQLAGLEEADLLECLSDFGQRLAIPTLLLTEREGARGLAAGFAAGARDCIPKPLLADELLARVGAAMESQHQTRELMYAARRDRLTGLPNRAFVVDRLQSAVEKAQQEERYGFTLMFLDFDRFKFVNDSLGHDVGDLLLQGIAERLRQNLRATDTLALDSRSTTVARLGGDEFVVLLDGVADEGAAMAVAERLLDALSPAYQLGEHVVRSSASIGITCNGGHYAHADDVIRDADIAMYEAKCRGKACAVHFTTEMREAVARRHAMENDLREAIETRQISIAYQPIVSLTDRSMSGVEALARWTHHTRGPIPPEQFIPLAEETRLLVPLSEWMLEVACADLRRWQAQSGDAAPRYVSMNLSRVQLADPTFATRTLETLRRGGLTPRHLQLEVTESQITSNRTSALAVIDEFREAGVRVAMDDFGTGYSSLSCLQEFPLDVLKIDRAFVANLSRGRDFAALVHAVVTLADNLGLEIVAEGVETMEQTAMLQGLGCHYGQGYLLAEPMTAAALSARMTGLPEPSEDDVYGGAGSAGNAGGAGGAEAGHPTTHATADAAPVPESVPAPVPAPIPMPVTTPLATERSA